jgi:hypothetical protein
MGITQDDYNAMVRREWEVAREASRSSNPAIRKAGELGLGKRYRIDDVENARVQAEIAEMNAWLEMYREPRPALLEVNDVPLR